MQSARTHFLLSQQLGNFDSGQGKEHGRICSFGFCQHPRFHCLALEPERVLVIRATHAYAVVRSYNAYIHNSKIPLESLYREAVSFVARKSILVRSQVRNWCAPKAPALRAPKIPNVPDDPGAIWNRGLGHRKFCDSSETSKIQCGRGVQLGRVKKK